MPPALLSLLEAHNKLNKPQRKYLLKPKRSLQALDAPYVLISSSFPTYSINPFSLSLILLNRPSRSSTCLFLSDPALQISEQRLHKFQHMCSEPNISSWAKPLVGTLCLCSILGFAGKLKIFHPVGWKGKAKKYMYFSCLSLSAPPVSRRHKN